MFTNGNIAEVVEHYGAQISRFMDGSPDPRGPSPRDVGGRTVWPTQPCWMLGTRLQRVAVACRQLGMDAEADRATELLRDLHGRAQSPEEFTAMVKVTGPA